MPGDTGFRGEAVGGLVSFWRLLMSGIVLRKLGLVSTASVMVLGGGCIGFGGDGLLQQLLVFALDTFVFARV